MAHATAFGETDGRLVENIVHFARALRKAGMKVGTAQVETAIRAVEVAGFTRRVDFYHILRATLVSRTEDLEVFHQVFSMFWRDPDVIQSMLHMLSPQLATDPEREDPAAAAKRASEALKLRDRPPPEKTPKEEEIEREAFMSWSEREVLKRKDFEQMSAAELREAERAIRNMTWRLDPLRSRRMRADPRGNRPDARATLRALTRRGGEIGRLEMKSPRERLPDLVALCDISGSMSVYSRIILRFLHAMAHAPVKEWGRVSAFTFGTSLTNVSQALRVADPDAALTAIGREAGDWEGGTRIGAALERFNKDWSRRVLTRGAVVLLISDGLERGAPDLLGAQIERLSLSARRLVWLNPLLRWEGFSPRAAGIRTILPHVDAVYACHSLDSLAALSGALSGADFRKALLHAI
ncbi:vWA domain-containing protein [Ovoidimarina sediminis]|uniref:vWA domain-containing protein n=1 Tax=Ovoidimarina sediminis TaxID=3079856 RepID=UPI0029131AD7|nr:VWA domain-containing protein [Rhodophyticola sp. MJ-SS7]MDU8945286.1 VWA domain-containing protein [Rhodophyticola sp. MJ-SS7]